MGGERRGRGDERGGWERGWGGGRGEGMGVDGMGGGMEWVGRRDWGGGR